MAHSSRMLVLDETYKLFGPSLSPLTLPFLPYPHFLPKDKGADKVCSHSSQKTLSELLPVLEGSDFLLSNQTSSLCSRPVWLPPTSMPMMIPHAPQNQYVFLPSNLPLHQVPSHPPSPLVKKPGVILDFSDL